MTHCGATRPPSSFESSGISTAFSRYWTRNRLWGFRQKAVRKTGALPGYWYEDAAFQSNAPRHPAIASQYGARSGTGAINTVKVTPNTSKIPCPAR